MLQRPASQRGVVLGLAVLLAGTVLLVGLTGCGSSQTSTTTSTVAAVDAEPSGTIEVVAKPEVAKVDLIMDWVPWVLDVPIDVAIEKGFYADAGLEIVQTLPAGPTDVVKFVSTGKSQFGLYYAPDVLMGVAEGAPLLSVAGLMSHAPVGLAIGPGLDATKPEDLAGKVVAVPMIPSVRASYDSLLEAGGVDPAAVTLVDPGFDLVAPLLAGTYQAVAFTEFGELVEAELDGRELAYMDFRDWGTPDYAFMNVITNRDFAAGNPNTVRAFVAATMAGLTYAAEHPQEAVDIYVTRHPELKKELLMAQWEAAIPSMATGDGQATGRQDLANWASLSTWMVEAGLLAEAVDVGGVVSNEYLAAP
ncbi:MAG: ABC transporter substrate-binding protein [Thermoleophilia bacterium]|nr:ABC transporter substrate-binding protein [Thermoleophilia bacterium]